MIARTAECPETRALETVKYLDPLRAPHCVGAAEMARELQAYLTGALPRSEALVEATRGLERKRVTLEECEAQRVEDATAAIALQKAAGLDFISDGQLNWQDLFRPIVEACEGLEGGALTRWFDNNTFYRKPTVIGDLTLHSGLPHEYFRTRLLNGYAWHVILPGPYTFARASEAPGHLGTLEERLDATAKLLRQAARWCIERGARHLQFSEPWLVYQPPKKRGLEAVASAYASLTKGLNADTLLSTYFGDLKGVYPDVLDFSVDAIGIDLTATNLTDLKEHDFDKGAVLGLVDGRNSLVETPGGIVALAEEAQAVLDPDFLAIAPTCELELCPRQVAEEKVKVLGRALELGREKL